MSKRPAKPGDLVKMGGFGTTDVLLLYSNHKNVLCNVIVYSEAMKEIWGQQGGLEGKSLDDCEVIAHLPDILEELRKNGRI